MPLHLDTLVGFYGSRRFNSQNKQSAKTSNQMHDQMYFITVLFTKCTRGRTFDCWFSLLVLTVEATNSAKSQMFYHVKDIEETRLCL